MPSKTTAPGKDLTLRDLLSRLTPKAALRLLGARGNELLRAGGALEAGLDDVQLDAEQLHLGLPDAQVVLARDERRAGRLRTACSACEVA